MTKYTQNYSEMLLTDDLDEGEFLIVQDENAHMVCVDGDQINFSPSIIRLTNLRVILEAKYEINRRMEVFYSDIKTVCQNTYNESPVLDIISAKEDKIVHVFIPDDKNRIAFASALSNLCSAGEENQEKCNRYGLLLQRRFQNCASIQDFYASVSHISLDLADECAETEKEMTETLNPFNLFADFVDRWPELFFLAISAIAAILSIVFGFFSFGCTVCVLILSMMIVSGIRLIENRERSNLMDFNINENDKRRPMKAFLASSNQFRDTLLKRLFWYDRHQSLEVARFMIIVLLLFMICDPAVLLIIALLGLAFFERWDPFKLGSFSAVLSRLILW